MFEEPVDRLQPARRHQPRRVQVLGFVVDAAGLQEEKDGDGEAEREQQGAFCLLPGQALRTRPGTSRNPLAAPPRLPLSWYSASWLTLHRSYTGRPATMFFTHSIAVIIAWSWLLYLCMPLRPTRCSVGKRSASARRTISTFLA